MSSTDRPEVKRFMADTYYGYGGQPTMQQCVLATDYDALEVESRDWRARYLEAADILKTRVVEQSSLTKRITELEGALRKSSGGYDDDEGRLLLKRATSVEQTCRWPVTSDDAEWLKNPHNVVHPYVCFPVEDLGEAPYCPNCGKRIEISGEQTDEIAEQQIENYYANGGTPMEEEMGG